MLCDICKKNEATIHIQEIHGQEKKSLNLCSGCAAEHEKTSGLNFGGFNLAEMLYNIGKYGNPGGAPDQKPAAPEAPVCPVCGWTPATIRESGGRLGCPHCYDTFAPLIRQAIETVHRGSLHLGKRPAGSGAGSPDDNRAAWLAELEKCRKELPELIRSENYEQAAVVRDRINELKQLLEAPVAPAPEAETGDQPQKEPPPAPGEEHHE